MRTLGRMTTLLAAVVGGLILVMGVRSMPDVKRYLKMRAM